MVEKERCSERVFGHGHLWRGSPCSKPVKIHRNGKSYCSIHDPENVKARRARRDEQWEREEATRRRATDKHDAFRQIAIEAIAHVEKGNNWDAVLTAVQRWKEMP